MKIICLPVGKVHDYDSLYVLRQNYCWIGKKIEKKGGRKKKKKEMNENHLQPLVREGVWAKIVMKKHRNGGEKMLLNCEKFSVR